MTEHAHAQFNQKMSFSNAYTLCLSHLVTLAGTCNKVLGSQRERDILRVTQLDNAS